jgi:hypothetical protein
MAVSANESVKIAKITANGEYKYTQIVLGKTIDCLTQDAHRTNCAANKWLHSSLTPGAYGYDAIVLSLMYALDSYNAGEIKLSNDKFAEKIHDGWCVNFKYWCDHKPYENGPYRAPYKPLSNKWRIKSFKTKYNDLDQEEKDKDLIFAAFLIENIKRHARDATEVKK